MRPIIPQASPVRMDDGGLNMNIIPITAAVVALVLGGVVLGSVITRNGIVERCETNGYFTDHWTVYDCHRQVVGAPRKD